MTTYRGNPDAVRALVQPDRVHRDLYISPELFELEQEHFFANTWNYVGHDSQLPKPGDYLTRRDRGPPADRRAPHRRLGARDDEPLRAQGLAAGERALRQHRQVLPLPLSRLDLQDRWLAAGDSAEERLRRHAACSECESAKGLTAVKNVRSLPRLHLRRRSTTSARTSRSISATR